ncbi:ribosome maturation factor RimP [Aestuariimicrobium soli]|uniref:ribosome maturation factor RimP n=1 Tax=Aestuariimicrobium soli TaxID=2035834 RepID=UPI003EB9DD42
MIDTRLIEVVEPALAAHGLELDDLEVIPAGRRSVLRITVDGDGPQGRGPLLDDISAATLSISAVLDEIDAMNGAYTLEVSSRGTGRPLTESKHYRRNLTRLVKVTLASGTSMTGRIVAVDGDQVTLEVTPESVKGNRNPKPVTHQLSIAEITKALVQVEMNRSIDDYDVDDLPDEDDEADDEADGDEANDTDEEDN